MEEKGYILDNMSAFIFIVVISVIGGLLEDIKSNWGATQQNCSVSNLSDLFSDNIEQCAFNFPDLTANLPQSFSLQSFTTLNPPNFLGSIARFDFNMGSIKFVSDSQMIVERLRNVILSGVAAFAYGVAMQILSPIVAKVQNWLSDSMNVVSKLTVDMQRVLDVGKELGIAPLKTIGKGVPPGSSSISSQDAKDAIKEFLTEGNIICGLSNCQNLVNANYIPAHPAIAQDVVSGKRGCIAVISGKGSDYTLVYALPEFNLTFDGAVLLLSGSSSYPNSIPQNIKKYAEFFITLFGTVILRVSNTPIQKWGSNITIQGPSGSKTTQVCYKPEILRIPGNVKILRDIGVVPSSSSSIDVRVPISCGGSSSNNRCLSLQESNNNTVTLTDLPSSTLGAIQNMIGDIQNGSSPQSSDVRNVSWLANYGVRVGDLVNICSYFGGSTCGEITNGFITSLAVVESLGAVFSVAEEIARRSQSFVKSFSEGKLTEALEEWYNNYKNIASEIDSFISEKLNSSKQVISSLGDFKYYADLINDIYRKTGFQSVLELY